MALDNRQDSIDDASDDWVEDGIEEVKLYNPPMEIEESLDLGKYHVAGIKQPIVNHSKLYSEEDTPRRILPLPEPSDNANDRIKKYRDNIIEKKREQKISSMLKNHCKVPNQEYKKLIKDAILVHQEFSEEDEDMFDDDNKVTYTNDYNLNIDMKYPFWNDKILDKGAYKYQKPKVISKKSQVFTDKILNEKTHNATKSMDLSAKSTKIENKNLSINSKNMKSSASQSRLRQPTLTSVLSKVSLESVKTNLMTRYNRPNSKLQFPTTQRKSVSPVPKGMQTSRNTQKENINIFTSHSPGFGKRPLASRTPNSNSQGVSSKVFTKNRFRF
jgi:hypothetical protein